jgi:hypothetical protein
MLDVLFFRDRVIPESTPGMTAEDSFCPQPNTFDYTPLLNRFNSILRTCWGVSAICADERRERQLIQTDWQYENFF